MTQVVVAGQGASADRHVFVVRIYRAIEVIEREPHGLLRVWVAFHPHIARRPALRPGLGMRGHQLRRAVPPGRGKIRLRALAQIAAWGVGAGEGDDARELDALPRMGLPAPAPMKGIQRLPFNLASVDGQGGAGGDRQAFGRMPGAPDGQVLFSRRGDQSQIEAFKRGLQHHVRHAGVDYQPQRLESDMALAEGH